MKHPAKSSVAHNFVVEILFLLQRNISAGSEDANIRKGDAAVRKMQYPGYITHKGTDS